MRKNVSCSTTFPILNNPETKIPCLSIGCPIFNTTRMVGPEYSVSNELSGLHLASIGGSFNTLSVGALLGAPAEAFFEIAPMRPAIELPEDEALGLALRDVSSFDREINNGPYLISE